MTDQNDYQSYLQDSSAQPPKLFTEEPPPLPPIIAKAPTGFAPMERIALEGKAYRGLASGSQPWWVIITGWVMFGLPCLAVVIGLGAAGGLGVEVVGAIAICGFFFSIMYRGTRAKLKQQQIKQQRRDKYQNNMRA